MVGASAITVINNSRQADGWGVLLVLVVAGACVALLVGVLVLDWWRERRKRREVTEACIKIMSKDIAGLPLKVTKATKPLR